MLDFRMETFLAVCQCMNLKKASEQQKITHPPVSHQKHFIEKQYKKKKFSY